MLQTFCGSAIWPLECDFEHFCGGSGVKNPLAMQEMQGFDPWVGKMPWRRKWQPAPVFLPGKSMDRGAWWATVHEVRKELGLATKQQQNGFTVLPLLLLPPVPPSIRVFCNEATLGMRWPKYWSFSFSIIPFKEIRGLISFRMDWLDLLTVQGTLKSLLQHHTSKASILRHSAFFTVQLSHPYMTTGKTIALTRRTLVGKVMSLLLTM